MVAFKKIERDVKMRALILKEAGQNPEVSDFNEPQVNNDNQRVVDVIAAGLNPVDRYRTMDKAAVLPRAVGLEGVGTLEDKSRVYFDRAIAPYGSIAQKTLVAIEDTIQLPDNLDPGLALTLGISGLAGWLPLSWKAKLQPGESVLILGATGAQGQIAVQAAKLLGASNVVAAGRNREVLESLRARGADNIAVLEGDMAAAIKAAAPSGGYDVVIDSLFGEPLVALLNSGAFNPNSRIIEVGSSAGHEVTVTQHQLQPAMIIGYASFTVPNEVKHSAYLQMVQYALAGKLHVDVKQYSLEQAADAWQDQMHGPHQKIVIIP
jgi:NADPH2:quinone reductase